MPNHTPTPRKTVELWLRSFEPTAAGPTHDRALEYIDRLETRETIESVTVDVWGRAFERTDRTRSIPQLERIEATIAAFEAWADRTDRSLEPFFRTRQVESKLTGDRCEICRLPSIALAEYRDDELVHVAPVRDGDRTIDVLERLETLLRGDDEESVLAFDTTGERPPRPPRRHPGHPR